MLTKPRILAAILALGQVLCFGQTFQAKRIGYMELKSTHNSRFYVFKTDAVYDASKGVTIENSFPKGGGGFTDAAGRTFGYRVFWTRVINETAAPLELTIEFPADSFPIHPSPDYAKFFLPPGTMTFDKEILYSYGVTGLESFLNTAFHTPGKLRKIISPGEEYFFYTGIVFYGAGDRAPGTQRAPDFPVRAGFFLKEHDLYYTSNVVPQLDSASSPWGHIDVKR